MKKMMVVVAALLMFVGVAHAGCCSKHVKTNLGKEVASTITDTGKIAADGTAKVVQTSVGNTVEAPKTAIQATKDTAGTALERADAAIKTFTGQEN